VPRSGAAGAAGGAAKPPGGGASGWLWIGPAPGRCAGGRFIGAGNGSTGARSRLVGKFGEDGPPLGTSAGGRGGLKIDPNWARAGAKVAKAASVKTAAASADEDRAIDQALLSEAVSVVSNQDIDG
jgi:hypothetical protein